jgi:hypothetical protein
VIPRPDELLLVIKAEGNGRRLGLCGICEGQVVGEQWEKGLLPASEPKIGRGRVGNEN